MVVKSARRIEFRSADAPTRKREAYDESATRQLHFSYWPVISVDSTTRGNAELLQRWLQDRSASMATARPVPGFRVTAGVLTKADRFFLAYAASALENLQSSGIAGGAVVNLSIGGLTDPLLPIYVVSQLQRRGVSLVGVTVALAPHWPAGASRGTKPYPEVAAVPRCVRHHTDEHCTSPPSWDGTVLGG